MDKANSNGKAALIIINFVTAVSLNLLITLLVYIEKRLRTSFNLFILNMCFADILASMNMTMNIILSLAIGELKTGDTACHITAFINVLCFVASVMALATISLCRYLRVVHWKKYKKIFSFRNTLVFISLAWMFSMLIVVPPFFGWGEYIYRREILVCFVNWKSSLSYVLFVLGTCFCGPIMLTLYSLHQILRWKRKVSRAVVRHTSKLTKKTEINSEAMEVATISSSQTLTIEPRRNRNFLHLTKNFRIEISHEKRQKLPTKAPGNCWRTTTENSRKETEAEKHKREKKQREERWITLSVSVIVFSFLIAWGPYVVINGLQTIGKIVIPEWGVFVGFFLGCMYGTVNPIISLTMNGNFRRAFLALYSKIRSRTNLQGAE